MRSAFGQAILSRLRERIEATAGELCTAYEGVTLFRQFTRLPSVSALGLDEASTVSLTVAFPRATGDGPSAVEICTLLEARSDEALEAGIPGGLKRGAISWMLRDADGRPDLDIYVFVRKQRSVAVSVASYGSPTQRAHYRFEVFRVTLKACGLPESAVELVRGRVSVDGEQPLRVAEQNLDEFGPSRIELTPFETLQSQVETATAIVRGLERPIVSTCGTFDLSPTGYDAWREELTQMNLPWHLNVLTGPSPTSEAAWSGALPSAFDWIPLGQWREAGSRVTADVVCVDGIPAIEFRGYQGGSYPPEACSESSLRKALIGIVDDSLGERNSIGAAGLPATPGRAMSWDATVSQLVSVPTVFRRGEKEAGFASALARLKRRVTSSDGILFSPEQLTCICGSYVELPPLDALDVCKYGVAIDEAVPRDVNVPAPRWLDELAPRIELDSGDPERPTRLSAPPGFVMRWMLPDVIVDTDTHFRRMAVKVSWIGQPVVDPPAETLKRRAAAFRAALRASGLATDAVVDVVDDHLVVRGDRYFEADGELVERGPSRLLLRPLRSLREQLEVALRVVNSLESGSEAKGEFFFADYEYVRWLEPPVAKGLVYRLVVPARLKPEAFEIWSGRWPGELEWIPLGRWSERNGITIEADAFMTERGPSLVFRGYQRDSESVTRFCSEEQLRGLLGDLLA